MQKIVDIKPASKIEVGEYLLVSPNFTSGVICPFKITNVSEPFGRVNEKEMIEITTEDNRLHILPADQLVIVAY